MNSNRFPLNEHRFESLDRKTMQSRRTVQQHRMTSRNLFQNIPDLRRLALDHFLRAPDRVDVAHVFEPANDEWLEKNKRHLLRQPALMKFQFRSDDDDGSARIIDALAQQVLPETSALALEHVAERFQRAIAGASDRAAVPAVSNNASTAS